MNLFRLALRNIAGSAFRSSFAFLSAFVVAALSLSTVLVVRGAEGSLNLALARLGADIVVVGRGAESRVESALVMGTPTRVWIPQAHLGRIATIPGVAAVSPQLYLSSLFDASCCSVSEMFLVAFDPETDFTLRPWLKQAWPDGLRTKEAIGGSSVFVPEGEEGLRLYGSLITLRGNLEPTGTNLDHTLFFTFDTAYEVAAQSWRLAEEPLEIPPNTISAALVRVRPGVDPQRVALDILQAVPGVTPIESPDLFRTFRAQIAGLRRGVVGILGVTLSLSLLLLAAVFSVTANERRREAAVLRALGATQGDVCRCLLVEAGLLALGGGATGAALAATGIYLFRNLIARTLQIPFIFPALPSLIALVVAGMALALAGVMLAALAPAWGASRQEPGLAMRG